MLSFLVAFIPGLSSLVTSITTAFFNAKVQITQAKIGGDRDVAVKLVQAAAQQEHENGAKLATIAGSRLLTVMLIMFAIPIVAFEWKVVIWDIVLGPLTGGNTDPIKGQVADWATTIIAFLFGAPTVMSLGRMWFSRTSS
jgi:hypothetical protein